MPLDWLTCVNHVDQLSIVERIRLLFLLEDLNLWRQLLLLLLLLDHHGLLAVSY